MAEKEILGQGVVELVLDQSKYQADLKRLMSGGGGKGVAAGGASSGRTFIAAFSKVAIVGASKAGSHAGAAFAAAFNKKANANIKINAPKVGGGGSGKSSAFSGAMGAIKNIFGSMGGGSVVGLKSGASGGGGKPSAFSGAMNAVKKMFGSMGGGSVVGIKAGASVAAGEAIIGAFSKVGKAMFGVRAASAATSSRVVRDMKMQEMQSHRLSRGVDGLGGSFKRTQQSGLGFGGMLAAVAGGNMLANMVSSVTQKFKSFLTTGWQTSAMMETMGISFEKMVGSKSEADALLATLQKFAEATPLQFPDIMKAATGLLATQKIAKDQLLPTITKLTDAAAGSTEGFAAFPRVVGAVTQMLSKGKVQAEEMMQLAEAGIPAWDALANAMGMSMAEVQQLGQSGKLGFDAILKLVDGLGKKFEGLADKQSKTWTGMMSTLTDKMGMVGKDLVKPFFELAKVNLSGLLKWMDSSKANAFIKTVTTGVSTVAKLVESAMNSKIVKTSLLVIGVATAFTAVAVAVSTVGGFVMAALGPGVLIAGALAGAITMVGVEFKKAFSSPEGEALRELLGDIKDLGLEIGGNVLSLITSGMTSIGEKMSSITNMNGGKVFREMLHWAMQLLDTVSLLTTNWEKGWEVVKAGAALAASDMWERFKYLFNTQIPGVIAGLYEGMIAGVKVVANGWMSIFQGVVNAMTEMFVGFFNSQKMRIDGLIKAFKSVKRGRLGDAMEDVAVGQINAANEGVRAAKAAGRAFSDEAGKTLLDAATEARAAFDNIAIAMPEFKRSEFGKQMKSEIDRLMSELAKERTAQRAATLPKGRRIENNPDKSPATPETTPETTPTTDGAKSDGLQTTTVEGLHDELQKRLMDSQSPAVVEAKKQTSVLETIEENTRHGNVGSGGASAGGTSAGGGFMNSGFESALSAMASSGMPSPLLGLEIAKKRMPVELPDFSYSGPDINELSSKFGDGQNNPVPQSPFGTHMAENFAKSEPVKQKSSADTFREKMAENFAKQNASGASVAGGDGASAFGTFGGADSPVKSPDFAFQGPSTPVASFDPNRSQTESSPLEKHQKEQRAAAERTRERIAARKEDAFKSASNKRAEFERNKLFGPQLDNQIAGRETAERIAKRKAAESQVVRRDLPSSQMSDSPKSPEVLAKIEQRTQERQTKVANAFANRAKEKEATQAKIAAKTRAREGGAPFVEAAKPMTRFEQAKADQQAAFASGKEGKKAAFAARKEQLRAAFAESHNKGADMIDKLKPGAAAEPADPMMAVQQQQLAEMKLANTKNDLLVGAVKTVGEQVAASGGYAK